VGEFASFLQDFTAVRGRWSRGVIQKSDDLGGTIVNGRRWGMGYVINRHQWGALQDMGCI